MLVDNVVIIPVALILFEAASGRGAPLGRRIGGIVRSVLTHPLIIAIAVALVMTGLGVSLPAMLDDAVQLVAQSSSAVALLSIGGFFELYDLFQTAYISPGLLRDGVERLADQPPGADQRLGRQHAGRDLIEQRLKQVLGGRGDQHGLHIGLGELLGGGEATEARTDDDDIRGAHELSCSG